MIDCCEECLGPPGVDGTCPRHPFARLVKMDEEAVREERLLRHSMRRRRVRDAAAFGVGALLVGLIIIGMMTGSSLILGPLAVAVIFAGAVLMSAMIIGPTILLGHKAGLVRRPWFAAAIVSVGWLILLAVTSFAAISGNLPSALVEPIMFSAVLSPLLISVPVFIVASVVGTMGRSRPQMESESEAALPVALEPAEDLRSRARAAQQREPRTH